MAMILSEEELQECLQRHYRESCGARDTDEWLPPPATNVRAFVRDGKRVVLNCHILTGVVTEKVYES